MLINGPSRRNSLDVRLTSDRIHFMAKTLIQSVVKQLQLERKRLENELHGVTAALTLAHRARCAAAILLRPAAEIVRFL